MEFFPTLVFIGLAAWGLYGLVRALSRHPSSASTGPGTVDNNPSGASKTTALYQLAGELQPFYEAAASPMDLLDQEAFEDAVRYLRSAEWTDAELIDYATGENPILAIIAFEALARRPGDASVRRRLLQSINLPVPWVRLFALRALAARIPASEPLVGDVLVHIDPSWMQPHSKRYLQDFIVLRTNQGEAVALGDTVERLSDGHASALETLLGSIDVDVATNLRSELSAWRSRRIDREFLSGVGTVWDGDPLSDTNGPVLAHEALDAHVGTIDSAVVGSPRRSVVLVGEHGVGKSAIMRTLGTRLAERGWVVFEAGHAELIAGLPYLGQVEERLRSLVEKLRDRPVLWYVPEFHALALAGRHQYGPLSALDFLMPYVERGEVVLIGETRPGPYDRLLQSKPRINTAFETERVGPLGDAATAELVDRWSDGQSPEIVVPEPIRREAHQLAQQFLGDRAFPGAVLQLLQLTRSRLTATAQTTVERDELITTLSRLTGLPAVILDERKGLDLAALRELFERRVLGQPEAVDCLVDRVAMIKAGVTDPSRPLGVFLFAGPTGTGKTEMAKTLAEFLFGSPDRMIRLDMSEFQTPAALAKIVGEASLESRGSALVDRIRKQPFAVILLDEFEKADPNVWDLFLQVFDDGRLSDFAGNTVDFRNAIVILTSNLGAVIPSGAGLGFSEETGRFHSSAVLREVERSFRKEFLNRIDRIVVFRPFTRETMREILRKELAEAFRRRGLRNRAWSVEWDESALELLLERGFTADLGARPLRRSVERYLLAPLSKTIVEHRYPEGDQFLFIRAHGEELVVDFVDPDAPVANEATVVVDEAAAEIGGEATRAVAQPTLATIGLRPHGVPVEIEVLREQHGRLLEIVNDADWYDAKHEGLARMSEAGFWSSPERFAVLGRVEYVDRIEAGLSSAGSLLERLEGPGWKTRERFPIDLVGRLARRLVLLDLACRGVLTDDPYEAFIDVQAWSDTGTPSSSAEGFARRIGSMYRSWGDQRRMNLEVVETVDRPNRPYSLVLAISGYAAWRLLASEAGLHVLELPGEREGHGFRKAAVRVRVAPQPASPPTDDGPGRLTEQAHSALAAPGDGGLVIVRHYRELPSPLVRDSVHGWRTGHLDRVLAGDFDLRTIEAASAR